MFDLEVKPSHDASTSGLVLRGCSGAVGHTPCAARGSGTVKRTVEDGTSEQHPAGGRRDGETTDGDGDGKVIQIHSYKWHTQIAVVSASCSSFVQHVLDPEKK